MLKSWAECRARLKVCGKKLKSGLAQTRWMRSFVVFTVLFMTVFGSQGSAQTVSYATAADVQDKVIKLSNDLQDISKWPLVNNDMQMLGATYLSWVQGGQDAELKRFIADEARLTKLETQQQFTSKTLAETEADAANALSIAQTFADAFPCAILNFKVVIPEVGPRYVQFTTPTANCTGWALWSVQTGLQAKRDAFSPFGTVTATFDTTPKSGFTFAMPSTIPAHGTIQAYTLDSGGTKTVRQIEY
jgi:hypothetical protein